MNYLTTGKKNIIGIGREVMARKKNGSLFPVELSVGVMTRHGERLFTGFLRDLTAHRTFRKPDRRPAKRTHSIGQT